MTNEELLLERLARIEEKLDGVARVEKQLEGFAQPWEKLTDLGKDLSILMGPATRKLTEELAEVEIGFQLEDLFTLLKNLLTRLNYLSAALEYLENLVDLWKDLEPILKIAVPHVIDYLDEMEQSGVFRIQKAMFNARAKIAARYSPADIAAMEDGFVLLHGIVRKITEDPKVLQVLDRLIDLTSQADLAESKPVGPVGLVMEMRSQECRQGLGVLVQLTRTLGKIGRETASPVSR